MKLLIVAMPESVHTARWILQLLGQGWTIYLFPSTFYGQPHPLLVPHIDYLYRWTRFFGGKIRPGKIHVCEPMDFGIKLPLSQRPFGRLLLYALVQIVPYFQWRHFMWVVKSFKPDLIHSMEFQLAGHFCLEAKKHLRTLPRWLATNWGSDVLLYSRLPWAKDLVLRVLASCDLYSCECKRDVELARKLGFKGRAWPVLPNTGGFDLQLVGQIRNRMAGAPRKFIMLKGYNGWSGRSVFAIKALSQCAAELKGYKVMLFSWTEDARIAMELASQDYGIDYELVPHHTSHEEILSLHAQARMYIGVGISDGVSTSCLEAMAMGAFPVQSSGACCDEWFVPEESGFVVDSEDIDMIADRIRRVLKDDNLVADARQINYDIVKDRLDSRKITEQVISSYLESLQ